MDGAQLRRGLRLGCGLRVGVVAEQERHDDQKREPREALVGRDQGRADRPHELAPRVGVGRDEDQDGQEHDRHVERQYAPRRRRPNGDAEDHEREHENEDRLDEARAEEAHLVT
jgi:hypothetical protein